MVIILKRILLVLSILNLLDGILTLIGLNHNVIEEYNPVMKILYDFNPLIISNSKTDPFCFFDSIILFYT
ncbi:DUF5658 family protein [Cytobacillus firmus]|uniref:DUF5658 family protein n=1 Tax=Cytobacillus TaxID=2675230 RepID=UPI0037BFCC61